MQTFLGNGVLLDECNIAERSYPPSGDKELWQPITVNDGAVIGGGSTVVPGCNIGANAVLAAGAVLTKSPDNEVWAGNPTTFLMTEKNMKPSAN